MRNMLSQEVVVDNGLTDTITERRTKMQNILSPVVMVKNELTDTTMEQRTKNPLIKSPIHDWNFIWFCLRANSQTKAALLGVSQ